MSEPLEFLKDPLVSRKYSAALHVIEHTGAEGYQIRYSDEQQPVVWIAIATYTDGRFEAAAAPDPLTATLRLCERLYDGGTCTHCGRIAGFDYEAFAGPLLETLNPMMCFYRWDPELGTFRRSCEGTT